MYYKNQTYRYKHNIPYSVKGIVISDIVHLDFAKLFVADFNHRIPVESNKALSNSWAVGFIRVPQTKNLLRKVNVSN